MRWSGLVVGRTHRAYVDAGADPIGVEMPSLRDTVATPPDYLDDYLDFVQRLRANPLVARDLLQTVELACFDALLGDRAWQEPAFAHLFTPEHKGLLLVAQRCLTRVAGNQVAEPLDALADLSFGQAGAAVPDRRGPRPLDGQLRDPLTAPGTASPAPHLAVPEEASPQPGEPKS